MERRGRSANAAGLTEDQLRTLREKLTRARAELRTRLRHEQAVALESEALPEALEAAEQTREQDDAVVLSERDRVLLGELEHALAKLEAGTYGVSELSGRPISFRRLLAIPWARIAADEAELAERQQ